MWKRSLKSLQEFNKYLSKIDHPRLLTAYCLLLTTLLYPGHNPLFSTILHPGTVKNFTLGESSYTPYPASDGTPAPATSALGIVIRDVSSGTVLYNRQSDVSFLPASTTKIMTAIVARKYWTDLDTALTVKNEDRAIGQTIELVRGEQITLHNLLKGLLIHSGNDAALALADNYPGGYAKFVQAMNDQAQVLHLDSTIYKNPSGIEQYGHKTTPRDLAILAQEAMTDPVLREIVSTRTATITDTTGTIKHTLVSTNELLGVIPGLIGLKTGWTEHAGECLVSYIDRDNHPIIIVVLASLDRFADTRALADWVYSHHTWQAPTL